MLKQKKVEQKFETVRKWKRKYLDRNCEMKRDLEEGKIREVLGGEGNQAHLIITTNKNL